MALASVLVYAVIGVLLWLSLRTQGDYEDRRSGYGAPDEPGWALSDPFLWCGSRPVKRQRSIHLVGSAAVMFLMQGLPGSPTVRRAPAPFRVAFGLFASRGPHDRSVVRPPAAPGREGRRRPARRRGGPSRRRSAPRARALLLLGRGRAEPVCGRPTTKGSPPCRTTVVSSWSCSSPGSDSSSSSAPWSRPTRPGVSSTFWSTASRRRASRCSRRWSPRSSPPACSTPSAS